MIPHKRQRAALLKKRDRMILSLERERRKLYRAQWHAPLVKLEKPRQQGWFREFKLRDDVLRRKDAPDLLRILEAINCRQYSRRYDFKQKHRTKQWVPIGFHPELITKDQWNKIGFPERYKQHFYLRNGYHWNAYFKPEWMLETVVFPRMITHSRIRIPEVDRRLDEIEKIFKCNNYEYRLQQLKGRRSDRWYDRHWDVGNAVEKRIRLMDREIQESLKWEEIEDEQ